MIRVTRVLRPLRAINQLPSLRILINLIFATLPQLGNVVLLCLFLFVVFAILCMNLFMGLLRNRCYVGNTTEMYCGSDDCEDPWLCSLPIDAGLGQCYPGKAMPRNYAGLMQYYGDVNETTVKRFDTCRQDGDNPDNGVIGFDNFYQSFVAVFLVMTMEGWTEVLLARNPHNPSATLTTLSPHLFRVHHVQSAKCLTLTLAHLGRSCTKCKVPTASGHGSSSSPSSSSAPWWPQTSFSA